MARLEDLRPAAAVRGVVPDGLATVVNVEWFGSDAVDLTYRDASGRIASELLYRHDEPRIEVVEAGRPWSFDGDGELFRLVSEAQRIRLAHLFDPVLAVHTSVVEPLPHQITAVYEEMLPRQPLRFLPALPHQDPIPSPWRMPALHGRPPKSDARLTNGPSRTRSPSPARSAARRCGGRDGGGGTRPA